MNDSILDRYATRARGNAAPAAEHDGAEDIGTFGWLRGPAARVLILELRKKAGSVRALAYGYLYDPPEGITINFTRQKVKIIGRNLDAESRPNVRLFRGLLRHRVIYVKVADQFDAMAAGDGETLVERRVVLPRTPNVSFRKDGHAAERRVASVPCYF